MKNTQYIIVRHHDTDHPHVHLVINRIDNEGKRISDQNEKLRNMKACKELTEKYGLYFAKGKENVKEHRLREPDKTKYEIYHAIKTVVPKCRNWRQLTAELQKSGIAVELKFNGETDKIQGVRFGKNGYTFNGSKIDRSCSYSKIDFQLQQNDRNQRVKIENAHYQSPSANHTSVLESAATAIGGLFDIQPGNDYDEDQAEYLRQQQLKKKKKKGRKM